MRILFLVQNYPPERGPVRYTFLVASGLAARGHSVRVVTGLPHYPEGRAHPGYGRLRPRFAREQGVEVVRVPLLMAGNHQPLRRLLGMGTFAASAAIPALLGRRPDVLVASGPPVPVALLGAAAAALRRVPLVTLLRDVEPQITFELRGVQDRPWARALVEASACVYRRADRLVVVHESQVAPLTSYGIVPRRIETIRHGIDLGRFLADSQMAVPAPLPRRPGRAVALYAGTVGVAHDVDALVEAFGQARVRTLPVDLVVMGDGERAPRCRRLVDELRLDNVRVLPPVPLAHVPALLRQADLLVSSYRTQDREIAGMIGSKFYEYCAAGIPLLVRGTGVAADLVRQLGCGWCVVPGDIDGLVGSLSEFLGDRAAARARGERARAHAGAHFTFAARLDQWERLLGEVAPRAGSGSEAAASA